MILNAAGISIIIFPKSLKKYLIEMRNGLWVSILPHLYVDPTKTL
jgi:hypothetical protein